MWSPAPESHVDTGLKKYKMNEGETQRHWKEESIGQRHSFLHLGSQTSATSQHTKSIVIVLNELSCLLPSKYNFQHKGKKRVDTEIYIKETNIST